LGKKLQLEFKTALWLPLNCALLVGQLDFSVEIQAPPEKFLDVAQANQKSGSS